MVISFRAAHLGGEAEAAIDGATDLRGDADRVAIILRHEDAFDGAAIGGKFQQVTNGAVGGVEALIDGQAAMRHFGTKTITEILRQGGCFVEIRNVALVERVIYLAGPERSSARPEQVEQVGDIQAEKRRLHTKSHLY